MFGIVSMKIWTKILIRFSTVPEAGDRRREKGDGRTETGDRRREKGDGRTETGDRRREKGDGRTETGEI